MAAIMAPAGGSAAAKQALKPFRTGTRQQLVPLDTMQFTQFSQKKTIQLPQTGFLSRIFLRVYGTLTTGAGTPSGTWVSYPFSPYNLLSKIRLYTSNAFPFWDTTGMGAYLFSLFTRRGQNISQDALSTGDGTANRSQLFTALSGATTASTAYNPAFFMEIPTVLDDLSQRGLIQLQSTRSRLNLDIALGAQTDITAVTGVTVTPNITVDAVAEVFSEPDPTQYTWPDLTWVPQVTEDAFFLTAVGTQRYKPTIGTQFARLIGIVENNGAQCDSTKISNTRIRFGQSTTPYDETYYQHVARNWAYLGLTLPDGAFGYDFTRGSGVPGILDTRDLFNTARLSDFEHNLVLASGLSLTNAQIRYVRQEISKRG